MATNCACTITSVQLLKIPRFTHLLPTKLNIEQTKNPFHKEVKSLTHLHQDAKHWVDSGNTLCRVTESPEKYRLI